ncbi:MAG: hypothetical protein ACI4VL_00200 [Bacilli bacterium]
MEKQKNTQTLIIAVLAVAVLTLSVGFASFSQRLDMNGTVSVTSSSWNVHFDTDSFAKTTGSQDVTTTSITGTSISWQSTLTKPGDYAEFTVNVVNEGTFDANLTSITMSSIADHEKYLKYEIYYDDSSSPYTSTTEGLSILLAKKAGTATSVPVKVKVTYIQPTDSADLPESSVDVALTASLTYEQA